MNEIELKWFVDEGKKKYIGCDKISNRIEIDEENKLLKNAKAFFREIIYQTYQNDWDNKIILIEDPDNEISEINTILIELIQICNSDIEKNCSE